MSNSPLQGYRVSPLQAALWNLSREESTQTWSASLRVSISGNFSSDAFRQALLTVIRRHEMLRTTFKSLSGMSEPLQIVHEEPLCSFAESSLDGMREEEQEQTIAERFRELASEHWNYEAGPMLRAHILRLSESRHELLLALPSLCADSRSLEILLEDVCAAYSGASLSGQPYQYADAAEFLREESAEREHDLLANPLASNEDFGFGEQLPFEQDSTRENSDQDLRTEIPGPFALKLERIAEQAGACTETVLLACADALLSRLGASERIVLTTSDDGRHDPEFAHCVGPFSMRVPRRRNPGRRCIRELIQFWALREAAPVGVRVQERYPWLIDYCIQPAPLEAAGLVLVLRELHAENARFKLHLAGKRTPERIDLVWRWDRGLFSFQDIERLDRYFRRCAELACEDLDGDINDWQILTAEDSEWLVEELNATTIEFTPAATLHDLFEHTAAIKPDAVAVSFGEARLSYAELDAEAESLAAELHREGVRVGDRVCVCMQRSLEMVISILGILKAGACYVPVDPDDAALRRSYVVKHSGAEVILVLTGSSWTEQGCRTLAVNIEGRKRPRVRWEKPIVDPESAAYLIYTSGSTGEPKGVVVPHRAAVNHMRWMQDAFPLLADDRVIQKTPFQFDASIWEFHSPLMAGAQLVIAPPGLHREPALLIDFLRQNGITRLQVVPTLLRELLREGQSLASVTTLRDVFCGGEALTPEIVSSFHQSSGARLHNLYGPTETTVDATFHSFSRSSPDCDSAIGRPVANTRVFVLDEMLRLVPFGMKGELFISGAALAHGYHNDPRNSAERFLPNPFGARPGERMYRTGDVVSWRSDGVLLYHGRTDYQVKVRGFRIELGEVEAQLERHPGVRQAVVVLNADQAGAQQLFAYFVPKDESAAAALSPLELREFLTKRLASYMVPSGFMCLKSFPLLASGKVDRKGLPRAEANRGAAEHRFVAPRTPEEEVLCAVWSEVLGLDQIGVHDNFFTLGGDSILTIRVLALAKQRELSLTIQDLFEHQTIAELAVASLSAGDREEGDGGPFSLIEEEIRQRMSENVEDAYPLTSLQLGMLYHMEASPNKAPYHNVNSWCCRAELDTQLLEMAIEEAVAAHPNMRTGFELTGFAEPLQLVYKSAVLPLRVFDISHLGVSEQDNLLDEFVESERRRLFDLSCPPLMRFHIHKLGPETFQFTLTECHAISDGWSVTSALARIYERYLNRLKREATAPLAVPRTSFREFVRLERKALKSEEASTFWHNYVGECKRIALPRGAGAQRPHRGEIIRRSVALPETVLAGLRKLARNAKVPLKTTFLTAHIEALSLFAGVSDAVVTGLTTNGRPERAGGTEVQGLFLNMLPLRMELCNESWTSFVQRVFLEERKLLPYRRFPLIAIQKLSGDEPLFDCTFNFVQFHALAPALRSGNLQILEGYKDSTSTNFALQTAFSLDPTGEAAGFVLEYDSAWFSSEQIGILEHYYLAVLGAMASNPETLTNAVDFTPAELKQLVITANPPGLDGWQEETIQELFRDRALSTPSAVAIRYLGRGITFAELDAYSDHLADELANRGAAPEQLVAVYMDRSPQLLAALLAILKTGAAFVVLDRSFPAARLASQMDLCKPCLAVIADGMSLPENSPIASFTVPAEWPLTTAASQKIVFDVKPGNIAYVLFTSGSTGIPKAIAVEHRGFANYLRWAVQYYHVGEGSGAPLHSPLSVDLTITSLFAPLLVGRCVEMLPELPGIEALRADISREADYSFVKLTPTQMRLLGEETAPGALRHWTRCLIVGGEQLTSDHVSMWRFATPEAVIVNEYGPTETVVGCCAYSFPASEARTGVVPIGKPITNSRLYLLDGNLCPVPAGVVGEIFIAGDGVARGYLGQPGLTAECFVPDPFAPSPGSRMYRSGDRGRYLSDLNIEFMGRKDNQVKVRGFRMELGEIEAAAETCRGVQAAVAVLDKTNSRETVVLHWTRQPQADLDSPQLRNFLVAALPPFMVPAHIVEAQTLPLLANGKVNRAALPELRTEALPPSGIPEGRPRSEAENYIAEIWREVLGLPEVGVDQNFFDIGGDSLRIYVVYKKLAEHARARLSILDMFRYPTVRDMAARLDGQFFSDARAPILDTYRPEHEVLLHRERRRQSLERTSP